MKNYLKLVLALIVLSSVSSCYKEKSYSPINFKMSDVLKGTNVESITLVANGLDAQNIVVEVPENANPELAKVTYISTKGTFIENGKSEISVLPELKPNGNKSILNAWVNLQSDQKVGQGELSISVGNFNKRIPVVFTPNVPNNISLYPVSIYFKQGSTEELKISANLQAAIGKVSIGQKISLTAKDSAGNNIGTIRLITPSNADEQVSITYSLLPNIDFHGTLKLLAKSSDNTIQSDTSFIYIK